MEGNFNKLGQQTSDVINNLELADICFCQLERGFTDIKHIISTRSKHSHH